jgi:hypothetical protein
MWRKKFFSVFVLIIAAAQLLILLAHDQQIRHISGESQRVVHSRDAFVQIMIDLHLDEMSPATFKGSGTLISVKDDKNYVLTADHLCNPTIPSFISSKVNAKEIFITDFTGEVYPAAAVFSSTLDDLCLLEFIGSTDGTPTPISSVSANINEKVFVFAAPAGFFAPYVIPFFEGYYGGDIVDAGTVSSVYTIPAVGGSSGAAVLNDEGEIVGVIHSSLVDFHHIALAATHSNIVMLLNEYAALSGIILLEP